MAPWKSYRKEVSPGGAAVSSLRSDNDRSEPRWGSSKLTKKSRVLGSGFSGLAWDELLLPTVPLAASLLGTFRL